MFLDKPNVVLFLGNPGRQETLRRLVRHVNLLLLIRGYRVLLAPYAAHILVPLQYCRPALTKSRIRSPTNQPDDDF